VSVERTEATLDFNFESLADQPYTVAVSTSQHGLRAISHSIQFKTSDSPRKRKLFSYQLPSHRNWRYEWHISFHPGEQTAQHDPTTVYALPFKSGRWVWVVQAYDDPRSHSGSQRFAIDFGVPIATEVRAARDGVVIGAEATSNESSRDGVRMARANYVWVRHRGPGDVRRSVLGRPGGRILGIGRDHRPRLLPPADGCDGHRDRQSDGQVR
jgi:murein DD-endopeptidase MepM/ murein hydrolase activator NlpD